MEDKNIPANPADKRILKAISELPNNMTGIFKYLKMKRERNGKNPQDRNP